MSKQDPSFDLSAVASTMLRVTFTVVSICLTLVCSLSVGVHSFEAGLFILVIGIGLVYCVHEIVWER